MVQLISRFEKVMVSPELQGTPLGQRVEWLFPKEVISWQLPQLKSSAQLGELSADQYSKSKRTLCILPFPGNFFKRCPGFKKGLACCNYYVLNLGLQCPMDCSYCYLQSYHNTPTTTLYSNIDSAIDELHTMFNENPLSQLRIGTGETMDSLALDSISLHNARLMEFFFDHPKWYLEFKTKTNYVDHLLDLPHRRNVIFSWSLNPQEVIDHEEHLTASLQERLNSARLCADRGFPVAFYLDPLIWHENWKDHYRQLIEQVTTTFEPHEVVQLAMGALRIQPEQRHLMRERFGMESYVTSSELLPCVTGKLRYDSHLRKELYHFILSEFKARCSGWTISLCMETIQAWKQNYHEMPARIPELRPFFQPSQPAHR